MGKNVDMIDSTYLHKVGWVYVCLHECMQHIPLCAPYTCSPSLTCTHSRVYTHFANLAHRKLATCMTVNIHIWALTISLKIAHLVPLWIQTQTNMWWIKVMTAPEATQPSPLSGFLPWVCMHEAELSNWFCPSVSPSVVYIITKKSFQQKDLDCLTTPTCDVQLCILANMYLNWLKRLYFVAFPAVYDC